MANDSEEFKRQWRKEKPSTSRAFLPYISGVTDKIGRLVTKYKVQTIYSPTKKLEGHFEWVKDKKDALCVPGIYRIPCSCGKVYVEQTKRSITIRIKEHKANDTRENRPSHTIQEYRGIRFQYTQDLA